MASAMALRKELPEQTIKMQIDGLGVINDSLIGALRMGDIKSNTDQRLRQVGI